MRTKHHRLLIIFALILLLGSVYVYFAQSVDVKAASSLSSSAEDPQGQTVDQKIAEDTAFLATLTSLNKITIDTALFNNKAFRSLTDHTVMLEQSNPGRPNPFANIDGVVPTTQSVDLVITNDPTQITNKAAVLNGTVTETNGVSSVYFEYGPTEALGKTTAPAKQSLIGSFVTSVTDLSPKTQYFFRAVAKVNNATVNGGIISFTTK